MIRALPQTSSSSSSAASLMENGRTLADYGIGSSSSAVLALTVDEMDVVITGWVLDVKVGLERYLGLGTGCVLI